MLLSTSISAWADDQIQVQVDPNNELLTIVARLADVPEFNDSIPDWKYTRAVDAHFAPHAKHDAVNRMRKLHRSRGVTYNAPADLAAHLDADLALRMPLKPFPERLDDRWDGSQTKPFLESLRAFRKDSDFDGFWREQSKTIESVEQIYRDHFAAYDIVAWFDDVFGPPKGASYTVRPGLLTGENNYGSSVVLPDGTLEFVPVLGLHSVADGKPELGSWDLPVLVHEFGHAYINPLFNAHPDAIGPGARAAQKHVDEIMRKQAYPSWQTVANESGTRACTVLFMGDRFGEDAGAKQLRSEVGSGFRWMGPLVEALDDWRDTHEPGDVVGLDGVVGWDHSRRTPVRRGQSIFDCHASPSRDGRSGSRLHLGSQRRCEPHQLRLSRPDRLGRGAVDGKDLGGRRLRGLPEAVGWELGSPSALETGVGGRCGNGRLAYLCGWVGGTGRVGKPNRRGGGGDTPGWVSGAGVC